MFKNARMYEEILTILPLTSYTRIDLLRATATLYFKNPIFHPCCNNDVSIFDFSLLGASMSISTHSLCALEFPTILPSLPSLPHLQNCLCPHSFGRYSRFCDGLLPPSCGRNLSLPLNCLWEPPYQPPALLSPMVGRFSDPRSSPFAEL